MPFEGKPRQTPECFLYVPGGTFRGLPDREGSLAAGTRGEYISHLAASAHPGADYRMLQGITDQNVADKGARTKAILHGRGLASRGFGFLATIE